MEQPRTFLCTLQNNRTLVCQQTSEDRPEVKNAMGMTDEPVPGPYGVGHRRLGPVTLANGNLSNISIWYPTQDVAGDPADYTVIISAGVYTFPPAPGVRTITFESVYGAIEDATVAPGQFPMVVGNQGSAVVNSDRSRMTMMPINEYLATHGIVCVEYTYHRPASAFPLDLSMVIDYVSYSSFISPSILVNKIGVAGFSLGGYPAIALAAGTSFVQANPNIKAFLGYDVVTPSNSDELVLGSLRNLSIPALMFKAAFPGDGNAVSVKSTGKPVYELYLKKAKHNSFAAFFAQYTERMREIGIANGVAEPFAAPSPDFYANTAYNLWYKNGEDFIDGTESWTPPVPAYLVPNNTNITPHSEMARRQKFFALAFWKVHLAGDNTYRTFLTRNYVTQNYANGDMTLQVNN